VTTDPRAPGEPGASGDPGSPPPGHEGWEPQPRRRARGGAGRVLTGLLVTGVLVAGTVLVADRLGAREAVPPPASSSDPAAAPVRTDAEQERLAGMDALLLRRSGALLARDRGAWLGTVDPQAAEFAQRQAAFFDNAAEVPFSVVRMEYGGVGPTLAPERAAEVGPGAWVARVSFVYQIDGADVADVRRDRYLTFVQRDQEWFVADDADGSRTVDLWDLGHVTARRGERSLVLGTGDPALLDDLVARSDRAARQVDRVWGERWPRTVVVLVPADQAQMAALLSRPDEIGLDQIAAVTTGAVGQTSGPAADRVIVNPAGFARLRDVGPDVVLSHEMTHVATRARGPGQGPLWVSEGFADYVAYDGRDLSRRQVAGDVLDLVREGAGPTALPTDADFDPRGGEIAPAYSSSWLAVDLMERTFGEEAVLAFVHAQVGTFTADGVAGVEPVAVEQAFLAATGTELAAFEDTWLDYLDDLAD
jgi:hypothetical protein